MQKVLPRGQFALFENVSNQNGLGFDFTLMVDFAQFFAAFTILRK